jgi:hypothetical protein
MKGLVRNELRTLRLIDELSVRNELRTLRLRSF